MTEARRGRRVLTGVLAVATLGGCGTISANDAAAVVDGREVSQDLYHQMLEVFADIPELTGLVLDVETGTVAADDVRRYLGSLVQDAASDDFLSSFDEAITEEDRAPFVQDVADNAQLSSMPDEILDVLIDVAAAGSARDRIPAPSAAELEAKYAEHPAQLGVLCLRQVVMTSEGQADDVLDELANGAAMSDLAAERSIDPAAAQSGGVVSSEDGQPCAAVPEVNRQLGARVAAGALDLRPGEVSEPIESPAGWHVLQMRPYDEVADSIAARYQVAPGEYLWVGHLATADVRVDPRYGRWDPTSGTVVALQ